METQVYTFEKYIEHMRHVEIQILADRHGNVVHLGERDCSVQRRLQKLVEESPCPVLDAHTRERMGNAAVAPTTKAVDYVGAAIEFIYAGDGEFYFMEMNTRIQVEHPVTEWVTGFDLVREQILSVAGVPLSFAQADVKARSCHRVPNQRRRPGTRFYACSWPDYRVPATGGMGVRVDSAAYSGYMVPPYYDSMIAKLIVWAPTREQAISRMSRALQEFHVDGVKTTIPFHLRLMANDQFRSGDISTRFLEEHPIYPSEGRG